MSRPLLGRGDVKEVPSRFSPPDSVNAVTDEQFYEASETTASDDGTHFRTSLHHHRQHTPASTLLSVQRTL